MPSQFSVNVPCVPLTKLYATMPIPVVEALRQKWERRLQYVAYTGVAETRSQTVDNPNQATTFLIHGSPHGNTRDRESFTCDLAHYRRSDNLTGFHFKDGDTISVMCDAKHEIACLYNHSASTPRNHVYAYRQIARAFKPLSVRDGMRANLLYNCKLYALLWFAGIPILLLLATFIAVLVSIFGRLAGGQPVPIIAGIFDFTILFSFAFPFVAVVALSGTNTMAKLQYVDWIISNCQPQIATSVKPVMRSI